LKKQVLCADESSACGCGGALAVENVEKIGGALAVTVPGLLLRSVGLFGGRFKIVVFVLQIRLGRKGGFDFEEGLQGALR